MKKIFKDAKFGDRFVTTDNRILIYHCPTTKGGKPIIVYQLIEEFNSDVIICDEDGKCLNMPDYRTGIETDIVYLHYNQYDVVEKYTETIDENEINKLADLYSDSLYTAEDLERYTDMGRDFGVDDIEEAYKAGYLKAKEE